MLAHSTFMPPYLLDRIVKHGSQQQRRCARGTLEHVRSLRANPGPPHLQHIPAIAALRTPGRPQRRIHDAQQQMQLPGMLRRSEGEPNSGDAAVDEAYAALGATYALFWQVYQRDSMDDQGMPLIGTVHYGQGYENAFWNGEQMVFGDGDGELFHRFTRSLDVVAHELTHGLIESEAALVYANQSGALNESISDVFGVLSKQHVLGQTAGEADWLIGAELLTDNVQGRALRSMAEPGSAYDDPVLGKDPQPAHMRDFIVTRDDNGGVHLNSGIPNRAFYLVASALGGYAWEHAGQIWYDTLCDRRLANDAQFADFARLTIAHGARLFGADTARMVEQAWHDVGVPVA
ncbi:M4 family metallopeptidase [Stutzerimonas stutzeri]|uniref:M4 family metallopeptidase n=1 Tax=Stutzerimonas sp. S1 TaxID=3030652 RepID=UPI0022244701|nr:M4 family metallopeptidase [Stutzerimonas sp. S1]MCW3148856.1 M4 family metallopeptidase [Stutzerimonas sp. S1]